MASKVEIISAALALLGEESITDPTENTKRARVAARLWNINLEAALRAHPWNFALVRAQLAQTPAAPLWGFAYSYQIPGDCLRVLQMDWQDDYPWKKEGSLLYTDSDSCYVQYIARVSDTAAFDALFTDYFTFRLAAALAWPITQRKADLDAMSQLAIAKLREARTVDGQEGTPDVYESTELTDVRM